MNLIVNRLHESFREYTRIQERLVVARRQRNRLAADVQEGAALNLLFEDFGPRGFDEERRMLLAWDDYIARQEGALEVEKNRPRNMGSMEIFFRGTLEQVCESIHDSFKPYILMIDCHYYFPQSSIDTWNEHHPESEWFIAGMNYVDHPMTATIWRGEAHLTVENGNRGTMEVRYKPRANKEYTHPLRNLILADATCLQDVPVESTHGGM